MSILGYPNLEDKPSELLQILVAGSSGIVTGWLSTKPGDIAGANFLGGKMRISRKPCVFLCFSQEIVGKSCDFSLILDPGIPGSPSHIHSRT